MDSLVFFKQEMFKSFAWFLGYRYKPPMLQFFQPTPGSPTIQRFSGFPSTVLSFVDTRFFVWTIIRSYFTTEHFKLSFLVANLSGPALLWATDMWEIDSPCFDSVDRPESSTGSTRVHLSRSGGSAHISLSPFAFTRLSNQRSPPGLWLSNGLRRLLQAANVL